MVSPVFVVVVYLLRPEIGFDAFPESKLFRFSGLEIPFVTGSACVTGMSCRIMCWSTVIITRRKPGRCSSIEEFVREMNAVFMDPVIAIERNAAHVDHGEFARDELEQVGPGPMCDPCRCPRIAPRSVRDFATGG